MQTLHRMILVALALILTLSLGTLQPARSQEPMFDRAPADAAVIAGGWADTPIFMTDPMVYTDDEGLHLFYTALFCNKSGEWFYAWDPAQLLSCDITNVIGGTGYAFSADRGLTWTIRETPLAIPGPEDWDNENIETPFVTRVENTLYLFYCATGERDGELFHQRFQIGVASLDLGERSLTQALLADGDSFVKRPTPLLPYNLTETALDNNTQEPSVVIRGDTLELYYTGLGLALPGESIAAPGQQITAINFLRVTFDTDLNLLTEPEKLPNDLLINMPEVHYVNGLYHVFFTAPGTDDEFHHGERIGYATSPDGVSWTGGQILLEPGPEGTIDNWGMMAPTLSFQAGETIMFYSAWEMQDHPAFPVPADGRFGMPISGDRAIYSNVGRAVSTTLLAATP